MEQITCKKCGSTNYVKNGIVRNKQRYRCRDCKCNFTQGDNRGKISVQGKALAVLLYGSAKASYGMIARIFNVSRSTVLYWIKSIGAQLPEPNIDNNVQEVAIDEMWHFIQKKTKKYGYGEPWIVLEIKPSDGLLAIVMLKPLQNSTIN